MSLYGVISSASSLSSSRVSYHNRNLLQSSDDNALELVEDCKYSYEDFMDPKFDVFLIPPDQTFVIIKAIMIIVLRYFS